MRIAHIEAGRHLYGGAAQVRYLTEGLTGRGVDNVLLCPPGSEVGAAARGAHVVELPMRGELDVMLLPRLARELKRLEPDLVHVHSRRGADLYGGFAAALAGVPAVLTRRVDALEPAVLARLKYRPYRVVVALSRAIERQLVDAGLPRERAAADPERRRHAALPPRRGGARATARRVRIARRRARRRRRRAAHRAQAPLVAVRVAAGARPRVAAAPSALLRPRSARAPAAEPSSPIAAWRERVAFAGFRADLPALLPGLDLLVHPAEREGLGLALLEAASAGVPVVACAVGGVPDVVVDGETGLLVPRDDAAELRRAARIARGRGERSRLGAAARRHVERRFDLGALVAAHLSLYARVLGERAAAVEPTVSP